MIVDIKIHSKPQAVLRRLLCGENNVINQSHHNSKLLNKLGINL